MPDNSTHNVSYYEYFDPSVPASGVVAVLFGIGFLLSAFQTFRYRSWIWIIMLVAILMETLGFAVRINSANNPTEQSPYVVQFCLIILAPVLMAGIIYVVFGRIVFHVVPAHARTARLLWVPPRWLTPIFVGFDIFALFLQLVGAVMISGANENDSDLQQRLDRGRDIALAGVTLQIIAFGLFSILAVRFHFTSRQFLTDTEGRFQVVSSGKKTLVTVEGGQQTFRPKWHLLLHGVNFACGMILIRSIYREVEFAMGHDGYMQKHEWFMYVFDAVPILLVVFVFTILPPGAYVSMGLRQQPRNKNKSSESHALMSTPQPPQPINNGAYNNGYNGQNNGYSNNGGHYGQP